MNVQEFTNRGLLTAFAEIIDRRPNADTILAAIGFPRAGRPSFPRAGGNHVTYWLSICHDIESGLVGSDTSLQPLVDAASMVYQGNLLFRQHRTQSDPQVPPASVASATNPAGPVAQPVADVGTPASITPASPTSGSGTVPSPGHANKPGSIKPADSSAIEPRYVTLLIEGYEDVDALLDLARAQAAAIGMSPDNIRPAYASTEGIVLQLVGATQEDGQRLGRAIVDARPVGSDIRASVAVSWFQDYLLRRLYVEGPDQQRFEINDIPASTLLRDVAQNVFGSEYYDKKVFAQGEASAQREVVVDKQNPDGTRERLDPDRSLHEQEIKEDDNLSVSPESTAGSINPVIRDEALARVRREVVGFAQSHSGFAVSENSTYAPTEYLFRFQTPSFGPPVHADSEPVLIGDHEVFVFLPAAFPMEAPQVYWRTPIFHPNIHPENGDVCLGALADKYRPGMSFSQLCQLLIDIASYQNYAAEEGYNLRAQKWVATREGQAAIERRGGKSMLRMYLHRLHKPRRLWVRRVDV